LRGCCGVRKWEQMEHMRRHKRREGGVETTRAAAEAQTVSEAHTVSELVSSVARLNAQIEMLLRGMRRGANGAQETAQAKVGRGGKS
jgi:hypothetical protein